MNKDITGSHLWIKVDNIPEDKLEVAIEKPLSFFNISEWSNSNNVVSTKCHLKRIADDVYSEGVVSTTIETECGRCLELIQLKLEANLTCTYTQQIFSPEDEEFEVRKEDIDQYPFNGERLDLFPLIRDQLLLAMPISSLCKTDCSGICPKCGKNKNIDTCNCENEIPHQGMEVLKSLKSKLNNSKQ